MKSAFAAKDTHKYEYPAPLDPKNDNPGSVFWGENIDKEVLKAVEEGESPPWVALRIPRSKGDKDAIADASQSVASLVANGNGLGNEMKVHIAAGNRSIFELLCEGWWLDDATPNGENFARLDGWASDWIMACIIDARNRAAPDFQEAPKNGQPSSGKRGGGRSASARASSSA